MEKELPLYHAVCAEAASKVSNKAWVVSIHVWLVNNTQSEHHFEGLHVSDPDAKDNSMQTSAIMLLLRSVVHPESICRVWHAAVRMQKAHEIIRTS